LSPTNIWQSPLLMA